MNMRRYLALYDEAGDAMYPTLGLTADYFAASGSGKRPGAHRPAAEQAPRAAETHRASLIPVFSESV